MVIRNDGDLENVNNSYGAYSDASMKENIVDANSQWDDIKALSGPQLQWDDIKAQSPQLQLQGRNWAIDPSSDRCNCTRN